MTVGALRVPVSLLMPSEVTSGLSVNALFGSWQVARLTCPVLLKRLSLNSVSPRAIFSGDCGLSFGIGTAGKPSGWALSPVLKKAARHASTSELIVGFIGPPPLSIHSL